MQEILLPWGEVVHSVVAARTADGGKQVSAGYGFVLFKEKNATEQVKPEQPAAATRALWPAAARTSCGVELKYAGFAGAERGISGGICSRQQRSTSRGFQGTGNWLTVQGAGHLSSVIQIDNIMEGFADENPAGTTARLQQVV